MDINSDYEKRSFSSFRFSFNNYSNHLENIFFIYSFSFLKLIGGCQKYSNQLYLNNYTRINVLVVSLHLNYDSENGENNMKIFSTDKEKKTLFKHT